ncbi:MAG: dihydroneopterin aldolase [Akkermansiaceae bacterium]|nr:dihydroneopterin aldolase [Akkermansiaceae bacterium]
MTQPDQIEIRRLKVSAHIGVPDEERAEAQTLLLTIRMTPSRSFDDLADDISRTTDYYAVSLEIEALAAEKPRRLIETLAVEVAEHLLTHHPLERVAVSIEKHILPNTECVAVHVERGR